MPTEYWVAWTGLVIGMAEPGLERGVERDNRSSRFDTPPILLHPHGVEKEVSGVLGLNEQATGDGRLRHHPEIQWDDSLLLHALSG